MTEAERIARFNEVVNAAAVLAGFDQAWIIGRFRITKNGMSDWGEVVASAKLGGYAGDAITDMLGMIDNGEIKLTVTEDCKALVFATCNYRTTQYDDGEWFEIDKTHVIKIEAEDDLPF